MGFWSNPACGCPTETERGKSRQIYRAGEQGEVSGDLLPAANPCPPTTVPTPHEVSDLALNFRPSGAIIGNPGRIGLGLAGLRQGCLVQADANRASRSRMGTLPS